MHRTAVGLVALRRPWVAALLGLVGAAGAAVPASAGSGGATYVSSTVIRDLACASRCTTIDAVQPGSVLRLRGTRMKAVRRVAFLGTRSPADDVIVRVTRARTKSVDVLVPDNAVSGPLLAINRDGGQSAASRAAVSIQRVASSSASLDVRVVGRRVFFAAARQARIDLLPRQPLTVTVALVRLSDGALVIGWPLGPLEVGVVRTITWDGTIAGVQQPVGRYEFRVFSQPTEAQAAQAPVGPLATGTFDFVDHKFPVRGKHDFGEGIAAFGTSRGGHSHQGQDVFAACGTPLVAARGGIVKLNQHQSRAGNYLVIDAAGTDVDYVYMHLRERSPLKKGARVMTGELIGEVGRTGDASACHLHFETWAAPGWYTGGAPVDPLPALRAWDAYS